MAERKRRKRGFLERVRATRREIKRIEKTPAGRRFRKRFEESITLPGVGVVGKAVKAARRAALITKAREVEKALPPSAKLKSPLGAAIKRSRKQFIMREELRGRQTGPGAKRVPKKKRGAK